MTSERQRFPDEHTHLVAAIEEIPGVARVVPGFRQILASTAKSLLRPDTSDAATGVDVVSRDGGTEVYVDCHTDGTRSAADVADAVMDSVSDALGVAPGDVHVRIMRVVEDQIASDPR